MGTNAYVPAEPAHITLCLSSSARVPLTVCPSLAHETAPASASLSTRARLVVFVQFVVGLADHLTHQGRAEVAQGQLMQYIDAVAAAVRTEQLIRARISVDYISEYLFRGFSVNR